MKAEEIVLPKLANYYISKRVLDIVEDILVNSEIRIENNHLHLFSERDCDVERALILIRRKSEKTTIGNKYVYEYELDMNIHNGCVFVMKIEGEEYKCRLYHVGHLNSGKLHTIFNIIKK